MSGLFGAPKKPTIEPRQPPRMPVETDPEIVAAAQRTRAAALARQGRLSTILTDSTSGSAGIGSSGQKLGA